MKKLSKLLLAVTFAISVSSSAFAVVVAYNFLDGSLNISCTAPVRIFSTSKAPSESFFLRFALYPSGD